MTWVKANRPFSFIRLDGSAVSLSILNFARLTRSTSAALAGDISRRAVLLGGAAGRLAKAQLQTMPAISATDADGAFLLAGKRTFLHGLYQLPNCPEPLQAATAAGFHVVSGSSQADLDAAASAGIYRWIATGTAPPRIAAMVSQFRSHPRLLFWETEDEPSYQWKNPAPRVAPATIRAAYALLKKLDPGRSVYLNHPPVNLVSTLQQYNPGGDILATDIYPVIPPGIREQFGLWPSGRQGDLLNTHISQVGQYMDKLRQVAGPQRSAVMVLQAFAWENLREKDRDVAMVRYPSGEELRFMAFHAIVRGANGLIWWGLKFTPAGVPLWDNLAALTRELRGLDRELVAPSLRLAAARIQYHDTGHSLDRGVEWVAKPSATGPVLLAVNADPNPVEVTIHGVFRQPRRESIEAFGVRVLRAVG